MLRRLALLMEQPRHMMMAMVVIWGCACRSGGGRSMLPMCPDLVGQLLVWMRTTLEIYHLILTVLVLLLGMVVIVMMRRASQGL